GTSAQYAICHGPSCSTIAANSLCMRSFYRLSYRRQHSRWYTNESRIGGSVTFRTIIALLLTSAFAHAASDRDIAEWVIRWEGRVTLEGSRQAIGAPST